MAWKDLAPSGASARTNTTARAGQPHRIALSVTRLGFSPILLVALMFLGAAGNVVKADQITDSYGTGTPVMSWAYSKLLNVGQLAKYWTYYPFQPDYSNAVFQGYVSTPADGIWGPGYDPVDQDEILVFRTYVYSSLDQTISISFGGDDNATVYVDGVLQDYSHIFTKNGFFDLSLKADVPVLLELALYNGRDGWVIGLIRSNGENLLGSDSTIAIDAVPEPAGIFLLATALAGLGAGAYQKRGRLRRE